MSESHGSQEQPAVIRLIKAGVQFPKQSQPTLHEIDLDVRKGEILAIVGPSGCGKSTLLRLLADLLPLTTGQRIDSMSSASSTDSQENLAMVFQEARLLPWRTVLGNMQLPFELTGQSVDQKRITELLELTGLQAEDFQKFPRQLSGGMKMRAALARSLVLNPKLLLLDEPFAAVDDLLREQLNGDLLRLQKQFNFSVVLVTHHIAEAAFLSRRLLILSAQPGQIVKEIDVPWGATRDPELRSSPEFAMLCREIKHQLKQTSRGER